MAKIAFLFPGQGAQVEGMCRDVVAQAPMARELFDQASSVLGYDLLDVCLHGPKDRLDSTAVSQPALFVAGLAAVEKLRLENPAAIEQCALAAGLSLGEYTALVFAGAMSLADGLRVVKARGEAMQAAADATPSGMVAVLGLEPAKVEALCEKVADHGLIRPANFLCPSNIVVSGVRSACDALEQLAPDFGAMKTVRLAVAGAFHTPIMKPADEKLAAVLKTITINPPRIPILSNVDAQTHHDPEEIRAILVRQVLEPVLWERCLRKLIADGCNQFYELGPGRVLAGLMKKVDRKADFINVSV